MRSIPTSHGSSPNVNIRKGSSVDGKAVIIVNRVLGTKTFPLLLKVQIPSSGRNLSCCNSRSEASEDRSNLTCQLSKPFVNYFPIAGAGANSKEFGGF